MQILSELDCKSVAGFYTQEIRKNHRRQGFKWICTDGTEGILAHVDFKSPCRVSKYGVNVRGFEQSVVSSLDADRSDARLFVIDEIGKMECLSQRFIAAVRSMFASDRSVLATVARKGSGLIAEVKAYPNVRLFNLTRLNYDKVVAQILKELSRF